MPTPAPTDTPTVPRDATGTRPIRFFFRGELTEVSGPAAQTTVLDWLRGQPGRCGTKEGCGEGDCGACTVVVGELDEAGELALAPVNSCIRLLPTLDGLALFTIEDLAAPCPTSGAPCLHPVQSALVSHHASQCGFCTPGFAMSLFSAYESHDQPTPPTRSELAAQLAGNLCRCTGYRSILDAAESAFADVQPRIDRAAVSAALRALAQDPALDYRAPGVVPGKPARFLAPRTLDELARLREAHPDARLLAGGTDVGLWVTKHLRDLGDLIYLGRVAELALVEHVDGGLRIGAAVSLEDGWRALTAQRPALKEYWERFAGPPVRAAGTLVGNLANGSPIGDTAPVLLAAGARLQLRRGALRREVALDEFYLGYMRNALAPGEFIESVWVPDAAADEVFAAWKVSKRHDCDISALTAAFRLRRDAGGRLREVRSGFGGMDAVARRARALEVALEGGLCDAAALQRGLAALASEFTPIDDLRASADYRRNAVQALLRRLWLELTGAPQAGATLADLAPIAVESCHE